VKKLTLIGFVLLASVAGSQTPEKFVALKCGGQVPDDFTTLSSKKFEQDLDENTDKELDKDFFLSTRFFFDELLLSGQILFNEPISNYLNKVAALVLKGKSELRDKLRFYILRSNVPNAYSTDQGIILFTSGLIAQLETEAQLAYILCHEISHFTEKHVRNEYIESQKITSGKGGYGKLNYNKRMNEISLYSKELELEADQKGMDMFLETEYHIDGAFTGFEVLHYSYLPFDDITFDTNYFSTPVMLVPGSFFPDTINEISKEIDYDDDGHTHPNIQTRIDEALEYTDGKDTKGKKHFIISEEDFFYVRNLARFEGVNIALSSREYGIALYDIFLLKQDFADNRFLDLAEVKALYGLVKYKNNSRYSEVTMKPNKVEGESYTLHLFLKNLSKQQLNVIAFRRIYDYSVKHAGDPVFALYLEDTKKELALNSGIDPDDLAGMSMAEYKESSQETVKTFDVEDSIRKIDNSDLSKYEKIRLKKELKALTTGADISLTDANFHLYALADLVKTGLVKELKRIKSEVEDELEKERLAEEQTNALGFVEKTKHLGIDKVVVVDPIYDSYRLNNEKNHLKSEDKKVGVADMYTADYNHLDLETSLVDSKDLVTGDVDKYNDIGLLNRWVTELMEHDDIDMITSCYDQMQDLNDKYGTSHYLFSGVFSYKARKEMSGAHWYGILMFYPIPLVAIDLLIVHNYFDLVAISINAETDEIEFAQVSEVNLKAIDGVLQAYIYDILYQLSSDPKQKNQ
jgi:beta-barrel assembly-enhancing protease